MKLRQMDIHNFRAIKTRSISFEDALGKIRPITVLAGPNGCGKTSVLFAIVQALRGVMGYRTNDVPEPSDLDIHSAGSLGGLSRIPLSISVKLNLEFEDAEIGAIPQVFEDTYDVHHEEIKPIDANRVVNANWTYPPGRNPDGSRRPYWYITLYPREALPWFHGRRYAIKGWIARTLRSRSLLDQIGGIYLFPQDRNLRSRVIGSRDNLQERAGIAEVDSDSTRERELPSVWGILEYLGSYSAQRDEPLKEEENWERRIQEQFKLVCGPKEYLGFLFQPDDPIGAPYFRDGTSIYPLSMAASGEQVIIEYIARLTYPSPLNHSLILIDEPEVHLHPGWIRQLYEALPQIGEGNQYILTTHSLELRAMAAEDNALIDMGEMGEHA